MMEEHDLITLPEDKITLTAGEKRNGTLLETCNHFVYLNFLALSDLVLVMPIGEDVTKHPQAIGVNDAVNNVSIYT